MKHPATKARFEALTKQVLDAQSVVGAQIKQLRQTAADPIDIKMNVPANIQNVFKKLGDVSVEEANRIEAAFDEAISKLPNSVAEKSSEKVLKGLFAIEGATSMLGGGVDILSALSKGWRSIRQSTDAANKVSEIQKAMMGSQFAGMKAYQGQVKAMHREYRSNLRSWFEVFLIAGGLAALARKNNSKKQQAVA